MQCLAIVLSIFLSSSGVADIEAAFEAVSLFSLLAKTVEDVTAVLNGAFDADVEVTLCVDTARLII